MSKYVIKRNEVCAGILCKDITANCKIYDNTGKELNLEELTKQGITNFSFSSRLICRGMLFNLDENELAHDLVYTTQTNYPIEGIESKITSSNDLKIEEYVELEELLKYLNYAEDLTQYDLNRIHSKLITHRRWLENHMELFGWKKSKIGYCSGGIVTLPYEIYSKLNNISCFKQGKPHLEEIGFSLIKKRKIF